MKQNLTIVRTEELAEILRVSPQTIYDMVKDGRIPPEAYIRLTPPNSKRRGYARRRFILEKVLEALSPCKEETSQKS